MPDQLLVFPPLFHDVIADREATMMLRVEHMLAGVENEDIELTVLLGEAVFTSGVVGGDPAETTVTTAADGQVPASFMPTSPGPILVEATLRDWPLTVHLKLFAFSPADFDFNGIVDIVDLLDLLGAWGNCPKPCPPTCIGDVNGDCVVDVQDLLALLADWTPAAKSAPK